MATSLPLNLNQLASQASTLIGGTESALATGLATLGPNSTASELLNVQALLNINSTVTSIFSSIIKERADCLKGICQKF